MRFKSVCKSWHALPTNPSFIASHLKHINTPNRLASWNGNDNGLIAGHDGFHVFTVCRYNASIQPVNLNFGFERKPDLVLGPCDGIFCLYWRPLKYGPFPVPFVERLPTIGLWNPATRAFSILPKSRFDFPPYKKADSCMIGFGFDLATKSIKVVKIVSFVWDEGTSGDHINCAEVYDLGSGSWRVLDMDVIPQEVLVHDEQIDCMYNNKDGVFHWLSEFHQIRHSEDYVFVELVLSFDMSRELFQVTSMPGKYNVDRLDQPFRECTFSLLRGSLAAALSFFEEGHGTVELWVMKKDFDRVVEAGVFFSSYSWSHELTVELDPRVFVLMGFWNKNELLLKKDCSGGTLFMYDTVTKQARELQLSGELNFLYRESLVSVKGGCGSDSIPHY